MVRRGQDAVGKQGGGADPDISDNRKEALVKYSQMDAKVGAKDSDFTKLSSEPPRCTWHAGPPLRARAHTHCTCTLYMHTACTNSNRKN